MSSDELLIEQSLSESHSSVVEIQNGNVAEFGKLAERLRPYLKHVVRNEIAGQNGVIREDESDLVQQSLVRAVECIDSFRGQSTNEWRGWLAAIARSQVRDSKRYWNAKQRTNTREIEWDAADLRLSSDDESPSTAAESVELMDKLSAVFAQLSSAQQELIQWRHQDGLTHAEIAARLNISTDAVRQRSKFAMDELRQIWRKTKPDK